MMTATDVVDFEKSQRETLRWLIIATLQAARPLGAAEPLILSTVTGVPHRVTALELRREMSYLEERGLILVAPMSKESPSWHARLTREGVDVADYTVPCGEGIARPRKYW
jgi:hypothetical protein